MWAHPSPSAVLEDLKSRTGSLGAALLSRDGTVLFASLPDGIYADTFAILWATLYGAAVTANLEMGRAPPGRITVDGTDSRTLVLGAGSKAVLVLVLEAHADVDRVRAEADRFVDLLSLG